MQFISIIQNTYRETIRDKVLYNLLFFALGLIIVSVIVSQWSIGQEVKILKDFGLTVMSFFGLLMAIFIGIGLVHKEIEKRTVYPILSKPLSRVKFLLGKYFGLLFTLFVNFCIMTVVLYIVLFIFDKTVDLSLIKSIVLIFFEMILIIAFSTLFSTFSTPTLSAVYSIIIYIMGHLSKEAYLITQKNNPENGISLIKIIYYIIPNLENFNIKTEIVHSVSIDDTRILFAVLYGILYSSVILSIAVYIFKKRDFK
ncbi:ABC transporter permease [candidate division KSB1 bacterium]